MIKNRTILTCVWILAGLAAFGNNGIRELVDPIPLPEIQSVIYSGGQDYRFPVKHKAEVGGVDKIEVSEPIKAFAPQQFNFPELESQLEDMLAAAGAPPPSDNIPAVDVIRSFGEYHRGYYQGAGGRLPGAQYWQFYFQPGVRGPGQHAVDHGLARDQ